MNKKGHPETLKAAQPGNLNAVKSGVNSERLIEPRAAEIAASFRDRMVLDPIGDLLIDEVARVRAVIEMMDDEVVRGGIVDKRGKERYLLQRRAAYSKRLSDLLVQVDDAWERCRREGVAQPVPFPDDPDFQKEYTARAKQLEAATKTGILRRLDAKIVAAELGIVVPGTT